MAYRVALGTGFRVNELRTLTPASFDLQADPPTVTVAAAYSKRRRQDVQPIRSDLAELLRALAGRIALGTAQLFRLPHNTSKMFQRDLAGGPVRMDRGSHRRTRNGSGGTQSRLPAVSRTRTAGLPTSTPQRHTYISGIVATGASVKTAQELARHSTPVLTIGRYSHARLHDLTGALDALPGLQPSGTDLQAQRATGTDDRPIIVGANSGGSKTAKRGTEGAKRGESDPPRNDDADCRKVLTIEHTWRQSAGCGGSGQGRDRTADTRIFSPLLYQLSYLTSKDLRQAVLIPTTDTTTLDRLTVS